MHCRRDSQFVRDAEQIHGLEHFHVALGRVFNKERTQFLRHADAPRRAGCDLFSGNKAIIELAMQGRGRKPESLRRTFDGHAVSVWRVLCGFKARDLPVRAQAADAIRGKRQTPGGGASLTIEDAGDDRIRIVCGQAAQQLDGIFLGSDCCQARARQRHVELAQQTAAPAHREVRVELLSLDRHEDFLEQSAQRLFAVTVGGGGRGPDCVEILTECKHRGALLRRQHEWPRVFATYQFALCGLEFCARRF